MFSTAGKAIVKVFYSRGAPGTQKRRIFLRLSAKLTETAIEASLIPQNYCVINRRHIKSVEAQYRRPLEKMATSAMRRKNSGNFSYDKSSRERSKALVPER